MNKHTPGPWYRDGTTVYALNPQNFNRFSAQIHGAHTPQSELEAVARLVAAAPELLDELKKTVDNEQQAVFEDWLLRTRPSGCFELVQSQFHESSDFAEFRESWKSQIAAIAKATA
ncbi:TPA: hypothetical protein ACKR1C_000479 [Pseudomonas aeruginosa]